MLDFCSLNFQAIERDLKQSRLQSRKESKIPEPKHKAKVINILSSSFILKNLPGVLHLAIWASYRMEPLLFYGIALFFSC